MNNISHNKDNVKTVADTAELQEIIENQNKIINRLLLRQELMNKDADKLHKDLNQSALWQIALGGTALVILLNNFFTGS